MIGRADLPLPVQVCQIAHASHEAGIHLSDERERPSSIVVCAVPDERSLLLALSRIREAGINVVLFREPDLENQATALATEPLEPDRRRLFGKYRLWEGAHA